MTDKRPVITAYCMEWHLTISSAFMELLVKPLAPYADIHLTAWDGIQALPMPQAGSITIFCQLYPPEAWLKKQDMMLVWIPMADALHDAHSLHGNSNVRVVAFSTAVEKMAHDLGLTCLRLRYFINPDLFAPASFGGERVLLYWNRTGLFHKRFLMAVCRHLRINRLIFRSALDPHIPQNKAYSLADTIGKIRIETHPTLTRHSDYLALLRQANVFIAPRRVEGVGIAFLEAMASGCCVIGYDNITMNDYIQHGKTGILFSAIYLQDGWIGRIHRFAHRVVNKLSWELRHKSIPYPQLTTFQNWKEIRKMDIATIGKNARQYMAEGYQQWLASIPTYATFVTNKD